MPSKDLSHCESELAEAWRWIEATYEIDHPGRALVVTCTYRTPDEQFAAYQQGRKKVGDLWVLDDAPKTSIVTQLNGRSRPSKHNVKPARALDFAVIVGGKVSWDSREYAPVGTLARERGLVWGGDWKAFRDYPHVELPEKKT